MLYTFHVVVVRIHNCCKYLSHKFTRCLILICNSFPTLQHVIDYVCSVTNSKELKKGVYACRKGDMRISTTMHGNLSITYILMAKEG